MPSRSDVIHVARAMIGTPYHHQGRLAHVGLDCIGLLCVVAEAIKMPYVDYKGYSRQPDGHTIIERLEINFDTVTVPQPGDVGVFFIRHRNLPQHAGIFTPRGMVHTYADLGKVVEQGIEDFWGKRLHTVFRFKGVEESYVQAESPTLEVTEWLEAHEKLTPKNSNRKPGTGRCENCGEH